jgi:hypothetical protein
MKRYTFTPLLHRSRGNSGNRTTRSVPQWNASDDTSSGSNKGGNGHLNTTDNWCNRHRDVFSESHQTSIDDIPFNGVPFEESNKGLAAVGIDQQVAWEFQYRI